LVLAVGQGHEVVLALPRCLELKKAKLSA
jgi:hypothetical protein